MQTQAARTQSSADFQSSADEMLEEIDDCLNILAVTLASDAPMMPLDALSRLASRAMGQAMELRALIGATRH